MPDNKDAYVRLGYDVDQSSITAATQANAKVEAGLVAVQKAASGVGEAAAKTGSALKDAFSRSEAAIKADQKAVDDLRKSLSEAKGEAESLNKAGSGGFNGEGLRRTGGALRQLGLQGPGEAIGQIGDLAEVSKEFKALAASAGPLSGALSAVSAAAGPIIVALGAISIGVKVWNEGLAAADAQIKKSSDQISQYYAIIKDGTTESIKAQIKKLEADKAINDAELKYRQDNLKDTQDKNLAKARSELDFWSELSGELEQAGVRAGPLTEKIKELQQKSADTQVQIDLYTKALGDSGVAANDATEAEKKLAAERLKGIDQSIKDETRRAQLIRSGTSTQVNEMIKADQDEAKAIEARLPILEAEAKKSKEGADALKAYQDRLVKLKNDQDDLTNNILPLINAREGEKRGIELISKGIDERIKNDQKYADLIKSGTSKDVQSRIDAIEREKDSVREAIATFDELGQTNEDARKQADEYRKQLDKLNDEEGKLTSEILPLIEAREAETRVVEIQKKFNEQSAAIEARDKDARLAAFTKYEDTIAGIEQKSLEARADLQQKYNDQLVDIARKTADEAAKALESLEQKQADLRTGLGRDEQKAARDAADKVIDIQIKAQREEKVALEEHVQRLKEIRRGDYVQDQKDLLDRNFQSIYLRRLGQTQQIDQENAKFVTDRGKREQTIRDEQQDAQRQAQIARRERLIAFEQQLADARTAYQRERAQIEANRQKEIRDAGIARSRELEQQRIAKDRQLREAQQTYQRELSDLTAKLAREKATLINAYDAELKAAATYGKARVEAERKTQQALLDQANARLRATTSGSSGRSARPAGRGAMEMAGGGYLEAGQATTVNEPWSSGRESFNGVPLPGAGLFIPDRAGYVNPNGGGGNTTITIPMTIVGATDPVATARAIDERLVMRLNQVMGNH